MLSKLGFLQLARGEITYEDTVRRAAEAMRLLASKGVTAVRTHVNVILGSRALERAKLKDLFKV